jgi:hypothetical protein
LDNKEIQMRMPRVLSAILLCLSLSGAETPVSYSFMPKCLDIDSMVHMVVGDTSDVVDTSYNDFVSISLPDSGVFVSYSGDTLVLPPGVLFSERKAALSVFYKSAWERQATELYYMKFLLNTYCEKSKEAEALYQSQISLLTKKAKRNWLERNAGYIGFGAALIIMAVRDYAVVDLMK